MDNEDKTMGIILKYQKSKFLMRLPIIFCHQLESMKKIISNI